MARPKKNNAEYYTHDADMRNNIKVKALRRKFSHMGYAVWNYLLETLTDNDYFEITWDEINIELIAADYDVSVEELTEIVAYCVKIGLLQLDNDVLRSDALQNRFKELLDNRVKKSEAGKKGMAKRWGQNDNIVIKSDNSVITPLQKTITENNKVEESKVKESKVKKEREEIHTNVCKEKKPSADSEIFSDEKDSGNNAQLIPEEKEKEKKVAPKRESRFVPPTLEEVKDYEVQKGYTFSAEKFWGYYESNGWRVGKNPMKNWHAACVTWQGKKNEESNNLNLNSNGINTQRPESKFERREREEREYLEKMERLSRSFIEHPGTETKLNFGDENT